MTYEIYLVPSLLAKKLLYNINHKTIMFSRPLLQSFQIELDICMTLTVCNTVTIEDLTTLEFVDCKFYSNDILVLQLLHNPVSLFL